MLCFIIVSSTIYSRNDDKELSKNDYLIILSADGFRWDYADRVETPNIDKMTNKGVKAEYLIPVFPSKTFPIHYTMATGLYPDNHGIIDNNFYCSEIGAAFRIGDEASMTNPDFYDGEPIWVTAEKQNLTSASYYWVGSEAAIKGIQPTYWKEYDGSVPFEERIDKVISWLELPEKKRPRLIKLYFDEPDKSGHEYGPDHPEIDKTVKYIDSLLGDLIDKLDEFPPKYNINLIFTSDHGMSEVTPERYVDLAEYVDRDWFERIHGGNPFLNIQPKDQYADTVYNILQTVNNINIWKREEIPARLNFGNNPRVMDMVVLADSTWSIGWGEPTGSYYTGGMHGWDHAKKDMHTIFYAMGPAFKREHVHPPFSVLDLYPLIAHILGLEPVEVDGKLENTIDMLR